ncbi:MAG: ribonuclease Y [Anaerolineae bacterium]
MPDVLFATVGAVLGLGVGFVAAFVLLRQREARETSAAQTAAANIMSEAESKAREMVVAAKDDALEIKDEAEREAKRKRREFDQELERLETRREKLDRRFDQAENRARNLDARERKLDAQQQRADQAEAELVAELERVAGMTREDAHEELLVQVADEYRADAARLIREIEMEARDTGEQKAREIVVSCIQRCATDVVSDIVSTAVPLPSDEMKGRIIGRQGRNIRAFEQATGVDVVVDDTPEAVLLSCFDPVRREVGRRSLLALVEDGRIHPARIEQVVERTRSEVDLLIREAGKSAAFDAGVHGLHQELTDLLGRLKFRTSYGQNVLAHSVETSRLAAMLAAETGGDVDAARAAGLLHDIGKAVSHEVEGPHAQIGADIAHRYGVPDRVVNAIASHHHESEPETLEALLVETADAISGSRPGARRESLELYIKRIKALENVANAFEGVQESYAIQAGREIRIVVRPDDVDDLAAAELSRDIARKVEETLEYPGQIKVTVIREMRAVEFAK